MTTLRWGFGIGLLLSAFAATGCDVEACTNRDVNGDCQFDGFDRDARPRIDASADASSSDGAIQSDGSIQSDGAVSDAGPSTGIDGGAPDAGPATLAKAAFCDAQYSNAKRWRDLLDGLECPCDGEDDRVGRENFLASALVFSGISACEEQLNAQSGKITYDASKAGPCAERLNAQYATPAPPAACPSAGFDIAAYKAVIGHGAQRPVQLPECRATFVGSVQRDGVCADHLECIAGLRCIEIPGGGAKSCQPARTVNATCSGTSDCADGFICSGTTATGKTCIGTSDLALRPQGGPCTNSTECVNGLVCDVTMQKCVQPTPDLICTP